MEANNDGSIKVTRADVEHKIEELLSYLEHLNEPKADLAETIMVETAIWASTSHYEGMGIFQEAMLQFRDISLESRDRCDCDCERESDSDVDDEV